MKKIKYISGLVAAVLLFSATACGDREPSYEDRETFPQETYVAWENAVITFQDGIVHTAYSSNAPVDTWLKRCATPDRDDYFDAYTLRHEATDGNGNTTYTYLIYYPHEGKAMKATPELLDGGNGYVINLSYTTGTGIEGYSLCYLSVTLPTNQAPRLRLLVGKEVLGVLSTVTEDKIPLGG